MDFGKSKLQISHRKANKKAPDEQMQSIYVCVTNKFIATFFVLLSFSFSWCDVAARTFEHWLIFFSWFIVATVAQMWNDADESTKKKT